MAYNAKTIHEFPFVTPDPANDEMLFWDVSGGRTAKITVADAFAAMITAGSSTSINGETDLTVTDTFYQFLTVTAVAGSTIISLTSTVAVGSIVVLSAADSNTTVVHSATLYLRGEEDVSLGTGDMIALVQTSTGWRELMRTLF